MPARCAGHGGGGGGAGERELSAGRAVADSDAVLSVDYGNRAAALVRARELAGVGAWVSVFGGEHDLDARLVRLARLRPIAPWPTAWELVAEFPPGAGLRRG